MPVTWPDGSVTGSLLRDTPVAAVPADPVPEKHDPAQPDDKKKETGDGDR